MVALSWVIGSIAGLAVLIYASFLAARYFFVARYPDEIHFTTTADGWRLALIRYRPVENGGLPHGEPVLLVPGIASNRYSLDFTDDLSLARFLSQKGYDTWIVELRGRGLSMRPRLFSNIKYDWSFDEYCERDLPAAAAGIVRATGKKRIHLVGFSTGALAALAWLSDPHRNLEVASLVSIGGATSFKRTGKNVSGRILRNLRWLRHRWLMRVVAPISGYWHPSPLQIIHNPENTDGKVQRRAMVNMIANFSRNEVLQYSDWIMNDVFRSIDQRRDYRGELSRINTPALLLGGARDVLATPDAVKATFESLGSTDKQFMICSRAQGMRVNYGHFDLVIGREAPAEIYPLVQRWLDAHRAQEPKSEYSVLEASK